MFTEQTIIELFKAQWPNAEHDKVKAIVEEGGGISAFECVLIYLHILSSPPRHIIEFSPNHGYSTQALALGQRAKGNKESFGSFEINAKFCERTEKRLANLGLSEYCSVVKGNANVEVPSYIKRRNAKVDLCFIDSDHRVEFADNYIRGIFPLLQPGCLVAVHDIAAEQRSKEGKGGFKSSLKGGRFKSGEEKPIKKYLADNKLPYCILHGITGGVHEGANLPINNEFYNEITKITGIDFRKAKGKCCPKTLFFRMRG